jgi:hypothetical protein
MNDSQMPGDELDAVLRGALGPAATEGSQALRDSLRGRSTAAFVRRRRRRRAFRVAGMAACYLLGVVTIYAWQNVSAMPADRAAGGDAAAATATAAAKGTDAPPPAKLADSAAVGSRPIVAGQPKDEHVRAVPHERPKIAKKSRFDSLRELGDRHLLGDRNPERALRCYRMALRYATEEERLAAARDGTWLLRVICLDAKQENEHASKS